MIDDKLKEIVKNASTIGAGMDDFGALDKYEQDKQIADTVAQIKKAFKDENYVQLPTVRKEIHKGLTVNGKIVMTGQEWYRRFEKEMYFLIAMTWKDFGSKESHEILDRDQILEAAKRASGL